MGKENNYSKMAMFILVVLRLIIGYHFLYEGTIKLLNANWTAAPFLLQADWIFSGLFHSIVNNQTLLSAVNILNIWGQIFIGIGLIIGLFSSVSAIFGAILILLYYIAVPPFMNGALFIDRNLLEIFTLLILFLFPTSNIIGMDYLIGKFRKS